MSIKKFDTVRTLAFAWTTCHIGAMQKSSPPPSKRTHQALNQNSEHQRLSRYSHISNYNAWYSMQGWIRLPFRVPVWTPKAQPAPYSAIKKMVSLSSFIYIYIFIYINVFFSPIGIFFFPATGLSSCSRLRGTQGARPDPIGKFGPRPRSVARVLGVTPARGSIPST